MKTYEDNKELLQEIGAFVDHLEEKYGKIDESQYLKSLICDFANNEVVAKKVWLVGDVEALANQRDGYGNIKYDNKEVATNKIVAEAINQLNANGLRIDYLEDCNDAEWEVIENSISDAITFLQNEVEEQMDVINFDGREYPGRWVTIDGNDCLIATHELSNVLFDANSEYVSGEAKKVDEQIYYYVDDEDDLQSVTLEEDLAKAVA